jgi:hypothetical protein
MAAGADARDVALLRPVAVPDAAVLDALVALAGAAGPLDVADAVCPLLAELAGVRAVALVQRSGRDAVVVGSSGYGCDTMGPGARLPLDSGLPATEAVRTGRAVVQGSGPGWCAVPWGRAGALLLSCDGPPPQDLRGLERLARAVGLALARVAGAEQFASAAAALAPAPAAGARQVPLGGAAGGDVLLDQVVGTTRWLLVADVCGSGLAAAPLALVVRAAARALLPGADAPAALLAALDAAVRPDVAGDAFVTALAVAADGGSVRVASAGHPAPLVVSDEVRELAVVPGPPLALATDPCLPPLAELAVELPAGALLVLYTDGLTDRGVEELDAVALARVALGAEPEAAADLLLRAADAAGPAGDDVSVLVARLLR